MTSSPTASKLRNHMDDTTGWLPTPYNSLRPVGAGMFDVRVGSRVMLRGVGLDRMPPDFYEVLARECERLLTVV